MTKRFDLKFWAGFLVTIVAAIIPYFLWKADVNSRSLHFRQLSQTSLLSDQSGSIPDLKIEVAGKQVASVYLTVFELLHDGSKPIPSADFESQIELIPQKNTTVVNARLTGSNPNDLGASFDTSANSVRLNPMLINPGDSLTIAIVTTGEKPVFRSKARIAGVQNVPIIVATNDQPSILKSGLGFMFALFCLTVSSALSDSGRSKGVFLRPRMSWLGYFVSAASGSTMLVALLSAWGVEGTVPFLVVMTFTFGVGALLASWLNKSPSKCAAGAEALSP